MSYHLNWHDDAHSILHVVSEGVNTWDDYHQKYDAALAIVEASEQRIDVIMEARKGMPAGNPLPHLQKIISKWHRSQTLGVMVVISARRLEGFTASAIDIAGMLNGVVIPDFLRFNASMEDALAVIAKDRVQKGGLPTLVALQQTQRTAPV